MERQGSRAGIDQPRPHRQARARAVLEPAPQLDGHRHRNGRRHGLDDSAGPIGLVEKCRPGSGLCHLLDRAAEVDIDDVRAGFLDHRGGIRHHSRIGAEDLHRQGALVGRDAQIAQSALVSVLQTGARDHLGADEPGAKSPSLAPKRLHADACHRRQNQAAGDLHRPDVPRLVKIYLHRAEILNITAVATA